MNTVYGMVSHFLKCSEDDAKRMIEMGLDVANNGNLLAQFEYMDNEISIRVFACDDSYRIGIVSQAVNIIVRENQLPVLEMY